MMDANCDDNPDAEMHPLWDPHRAAKNIEVGDKRKNYRAAP
jgi:hypothetical protein